MSDEHDPNSRDEVPFPNQRGPRRWPAQSQLGGPPAQQEASAEEQLAEFQSQQIAARRMMDEYRQQQNDNGRQAQQGYSQPVTSPPGSTLRLMAALVGVIDAYSREVGCPQSYAASRAMEAVNILRSPEGADIVRFLMG